MPILGQSPFSSIFAFSLPLSSKSHFQSLVARQLGSRHHPTRSSLRWQPSSWWWWWWWLWWWLWWLWWWWPWRWRWRQQRRWWWWNAMHALRIIWENISVFRHSRMLVLINHGRVPRRYFDCHNQICLNNTVIIVIAQGTSLALYQDFITGSFYASPKWVLHAFPLIFIDIICATPPNAELRQSLPLYSSVLYSLRTLLLYSTGPDHLHLFFITWS